MGIPERIVSGDVDRTVGDYRQGAGFIKNTALEHALSPLLQSVMVRGCVRIIRERTTIDVDPPVGTEIIRDGVDAAFFIADRTGFGISYGSGNAQRSAAVHGDFTTVNAVGVRPAFCASCVTVERVRDSGCCNACTVHHCRGSGIGIEDTCRGAGDGSFIRPADVDVLISQFRVSRQVNFAVDRQRTAILDAFHSGICAFV